MTSYDVILFLLSLLFGLVLRRSAPILEICIIEQMERKLNSLENQKRKLKRQLSDLKAKACKSETKLAEDVSTAREGQAQVIRNLQAERERAASLEKSLQCRVDEAARLNDEKHKLQCTVASVQKNLKVFVELGKQRRCELEEAARCLEVASHNREETFKLLHFCRSTVLENLEGAMELAERRNAAVSKLYFDVFGETNGNVQLLSELTDPWRRWGEVLSSQRDRMDHVFAHCLERAGRNKRINLDDLPGSVVLQEPDYGFDRILDLVRVRLSPMSRVESLADFESYIPVADSPTSTAGFAGVRKSGYLRLARTLHKRMPDVSEERLVSCLETLRSQNGGLTGLRISAIRDEVSKLVREWPSAVR